MIDVATWTVSSRTQPLSGHAASSSTSRPLRGVKPELPRSPTTSCPNKQKIGVIRLMSTTSTSHKTPTQSLCALRLSYLSSSSCTCSHRVSTLCSCVREGSDDCRGATTRWQLPAVCQFCPWHGVSIRLNQCATTSIPVHGNLSRQCPDDISTRLDTEKQRDTCTHRDVHRPTERLRQRHNQRDLDRDPLRHFR